MKTTQTVIALTLALVSGMIATTLLSGCQKPSTRGTSESSDTNTSAVEDLDISIPEYGTGERVTAEIPAEETTAPLSAPTDAPKDEPVKPAVKEPAAEVKQEQPKSEPAPEKPAEEPVPAQPAASEESKPAAGEVSAKPATSPIDKTANAPIKPGDWAQWGGTSYRNNTPIGKDIPIEWNVGKFDRKTGDWISDDAQNIKWVARVGSQTYGNPVVAGGRVYVGTNNGAGWLKRYPSNIDLGCLLAFSEEDGSFLWQDSSEKLPTYKVHDWPLQGICCAPLVEGDRLWYVTSRGEVKCLDTEGFYDGEDDGPVQNQLAAIFDIMRNEDAAQDQVGPSAKELDEAKLPALLREQFKERGVDLPEEVAIAVEEAGKKWTLTAKIGESDRTFKLMIAGPRLAAFKLVTPDDKEEADVVWSFDMMAELSVSQHNMCSCSVTALGDILFVNTSNGLDETHINLPQPNAPSFIAMDKTTGEVYWTDKSPGMNILHGQWSSPTVAHLGGVDQVIFAAGDGWTYSFKADKGTDGKPELLWKFDANPKTSKWILGGRGTRNNIIATPVVYDGLVYVAVGQDPEHGESEGHVWCIDPTKRGDVSSQLAMKVEGDKRVPIEHRRLQAVIEEDGEIAVDNKNSAVVWHYSQYDQNGDGEFDFEEEMHRTIGTVAIQDDLLYIADFSGLFHCLDAKTGKVHWTYDMLAAAWGSPLIVDGHVYIGDEDGDVCIFKLSAEPHEPLAEINMGNSVYSTPIVANDVLYIANKTHIFAIKGSDGAE
ncbi:MAG TPA: PQQ-binding-like beta-propeller repeat protein [Pirellulaceae bacterium]|nr:PQQ-binding-like beta-propeller repeat protein [Pirellulaceae bacterium]